MNRVSLILSVVGLVSIPSRVFSFRLLALPAITLIHRHLQSLTMLNFSRKKHPGQCRVLFSLASAVFFDVHLVCRGYDCTDRRSREDGFRLFSCHLLFLLLDHFLYHISTDRSVLFGCQVAVVSVCQRYSQLCCYLVLELVECAFASGTAALLDERLAMIHFLLLHPAVCLKTAFPELL